jgi:hypothetical protein
MMPGRLSAFAELRFGRRRGRRDFDAGDQLTAQELQLAAQGLSNRDITQRLYLSPDDRHTPVPHLPPARAHQPGELSSAFSSSTALGKR